MSYVQQRLNDKDIEILTQALFDWCSRSKSEPNDAVTAHAVRLYFCGCTTPEAILSELSEQSVH